jgi:predicted AlkP superfamily phosphohydrolase/phosphomutase
MKRSQRRTLSILLLSLALAGPSLAAESLFIMGWDGAGLVNINRLLDENKLPNLQALLDSGSQIVPLESIGRTETGTAWANAFTGLTYDQTGVLGLRNYDDFFDGELDRGYNAVTGLYVGMQYWYVKLPFEHTIFSHLKGRPSRLGWFTSKRLLYEDDPLEPDRPSGLWEEVAQQAQAKWLSKPNEDGDDYIDILGEKALQFLDLFSNRTFTLFLHVDPDFYGHQSGENSLEYEAEFIRSDVWLGTIMAQLNLAETRIIVMADHGFNEDASGHPFAPDAWMITDIPIDPAYVQQPDQKAFGTLRDVAPTILQHFGFDWKSFFPDMRGKSLNAAAESGGPKALPPTREQAPARPQRPQ